LGEAFNFTHRFRVPLSSGQFAKGSGIQFQDGSGTLDRVIVKNSVTQLSYFLCAYSGSFRELTIGDAQTLLRFSYDIRKVVFERDGHASMKDHLCAASRIMGHEQSVSLQFQTGAG
jgi:hypothetical protein